VGEVYRIYLAQREPGGVVVTGQPGIDTFAPCFQRKSYSTGNTLFLQWLLLDRLLDGKPTILQTRDNYASFFAGSFSRISELNLGSSMDTWLLVDPQIAGGGPPMRCRLFTIFTASPAEATHKDWMKQCSGRLLIMNPWTWEELNFVGYVCFV
jgi:hypothetical protein